MVYLIFLSTVAFVVSLAAKNLSFRLVCVTAAFPLALFAAFRGAEVGADFLVYESWYSGSKEAGGYLERTGFLEYIYFFLNDNLAKIGVPFRVFIGLLAFLSVFIKTAVIFKFSNKRFAFFISLIFYFFSFYLLHDFIQIRVGLAVAFIFLAFNFLLNDRKNLCILALLFAIGFHSSAMIAFSMLYPTSGKKNKYLEYILIVSLLVAYGMAFKGLSLGFLAIDIFRNIDPRLDLYISFSESDLAVSANPFSFASMILVAISLLIMKIKINGKPIFYISDTIEKAFCIIRRNIIIGVLFLVSFYPIPELALRMFELNVALVPILVAVIFSQQGMVLQKSLLSLWALSIVYLFVIKGALVKPYVACLIDCSRI